MFTFDYFFKLLEGKISREDSVVADHFFENLFSTRIMAFLVYFDTIDRKWPFGVGLVVSLNDLSTNLADM